MTSVDTHKAWLSIIGIGQDGWDGLGTEAKLLIASADLLYGGVRHLSFVASEIDGPKQIAWPSPMAAAISEILIEHRAKRRVVVLGSGDPMLYGVGVTLCRSLPASEFCVVPQVSAFSLACARMGWPLVETTLVSLVSRPIEQLLLHLAPGQRLVLYSEDGTTPARVAKLLVRSGYGTSTLHVLEHLGGPQEDQMSETAAAWIRESVAPLNVIAFICVADKNASLLSRVPGLPDDAFETDGQLTKREVRAATLARLAPLPGQTLWDVGAGTGSVGIEWMRVHPSCSCIAFEAKAERAARIAQNARELGVPGLKVIEGVAPASFAGLPAPDAIFIGGGIGVDGLFQACWQHLLPGGRLVANAVTIANESNLAACHGLYGGDLTRIQVSRAEQIGGTLAWRPMMPITQWTVTKP